MIRAKLSQQVMQLAIRVMPKNHDQWSRAMLSEWQHENGSLPFALGCLKTSLFRHLNIALYEPLARIWLSLMILAWAGAKFYAASLLTTAGLSIGLIFALGLTGIAYAGLSGAVLAKRWPAIIATVCILAGLNAAQFFAISLPMTMSSAVQTRPSFMMLAIIGEEYFILTSTAFGLGFIYMWQNRFKNLIRGKR